MFMGDLYVRIMVAVVPGDSTSCGGDSHGAPTEYAKPEELTLRFAKIAGQFVGVKIRDDSITL